MCFKSKRYVCMSTRPFLDGLISLSNLPSFGAKKNMAPAGCDVIGWTPRMELPLLASKSLSANVRFCRNSMKTRFPLNEQVAPGKRKVVKSILGVNLLRFLEAVDRSRCGQPLSESKEQNVHR